MMACLCQPQVYREAFIIASLRPFVFYLLVSHTKKNPARISLEEFCQTALDIVQRKVTIETVDHGAGAGGGGDVAVAVYEKVHEKISMPRVRGDSVGVTPILRHETPIFLNNLGIIFSLHKCP